MKNQKKNASREKEGLWRRIPAEVWVILAIVILVCGRRGFIVWQTPKHLTEIARAHGYVGLLYGVPQANADGSKLVYSQMNKDGIGAYLLDLKSGHKVLVHEKVSTDDWFQNLDVWPWSPDGKYFIYTHTNLFVCSAATGKAVGELPVEGVNGVVSLVWLSPTSFVYVSRTGNLHQFECGEDDRWREIDRGYFRAAADNLTAISADTICWQKANCIWSLNLVFRVATVLFNAETNQLDGFSYSSKSGQFLVNCTGQQSNMLWQTVRDGAVLENDKQVATVASAHNVQWLDGEKGVCAYIGANPGKPDNRYLEILPLPTAKPARLFAQGKVDAMTASADGSKLFVVGTISNEPAASMWEYNTDSGSLRCLIPGSDYPSPYARRVESRQVTVTWNSDRRFNYHVYEPLGLNPHAHRKYPLVIGDTLFKALDPAYQNRVHGPYWAPMLANAGAYVVIVERPGAWGNEMEYWEEYVDWVCKRMLENPTIDPNQVYLYATSAETEHLCNLAQKNPQHWKGLMLLSPGELPDLKILSESKSPPKILVSQGVLEGTNRVHQYQLEAVKNGVRLEYYTHEGSAHILLGKQALGERAEAMMKFVFGD